jgi:hypothetical protein
MPKAAKYRWFPERNVIVYKASVDTKSCRYQPSASANNTELCPKSTCHTKPD